MVQSTQGAFTAGVPEHMRVPLTAPVDRQVDAGPEVLPPLVLVTAAATGVGLHGAPGLAASLPRFPVVAASGAAGHAWVLVADGDVLALPGSTVFGRLRLVGRRGDAASQRVAALDIAATPSGRGYWILTSDGRLHAFGDATPAGRDLLPDRVAAVAAGPHGGLWVGTHDGVVLGVGGAPPGRLRRAPGRRLVRLAALPDGSGCLALDATGVVERTSDGELVGIAPVHHRAADLAVVGRGAWVLADDGTVHAVGGAPAPRRQLTGPVRFVAVAVTA